MVFASPSGLRSRTVREQEEISYEHDVSVFPLAILLLAEPGAITTVLLYTGERSATELAVFIAVLLAVLLLTLVSLPLAPRIMLLFGETGSNVLTRVLGVLLAALAVQFVLDGIGASLGQRERRHLHVDARVYTLPYGARSDSPRRWIGVVAVEVPGVRADPARDLRLGGARRPDHAFRLASGAS